MSSTDARAPDGSQRERKTSVNATSNVVYVRHLDGATNARWPTTRRGWSTFKASSPAKSGRQFTAGPNHPDARRDRLRLARPLKLREPSGTTSSARSSRACPPLGDCASSVQARNVAASRSRATSQAVVTPGISTSRSLEAADPRVRGSFLRPLSGMARGCSSSGCPGRTAAAARAFRRRRCLRRR
ncbi:MAG: hypothetical protein QOK16_603 [Solirubrobacteraceae bacterium]|jgi:hypothetical protein|nr:hypothetical protein [Solirubrobacteraceae bacterium]